MKKIIAVLLMLVATTSYGWTWVYNGIVYGNVCRAGPVFFVFNGGGAPVGTSCWFTLGGLTYYGQISNE